MEKIKEIGKKIKNYFKDKKITKKEGLYIAIFTVVCISLISGVVVLKNIKTDKVDSTQKPEKEIALEVPDTETNAGVKENSERVEKEPETTKPVTSTPKLEFTNPVEGKLIKANDEAIISEDGLRSDMFGGISIEAKVGTDVKAGEAGIIDEVKTNDITFGTSITIKHANGMKSEYCNLDANLKVKKGDTVTKGQIIGNIGKTAQSLQAALKCDFLHIKMYQMKDKTYQEIDPAKFFSFKK